MGETSRVFLGVCLGLGLFWAMFGPSPVLDR
jgi:hypothetical protein